MVIRTSIFILVILILYPMYLSFSNKSIVYATLTNNAFLEIHIILRACHNANTFIWNDILEKDAITKASTCIFAHTNSEYGENICTGFSIYDCLYTWYNEKQIYPCVHSNTCEPSKWNNKWGHYTQMIWNTSMYLGCAMREDCQNGPLIFCLYYPPGNVLGYFSQNVFMDMC